MEMTKESGITYEDWMKEVNKVVSDALLGMDTDMFPDWMSRDSYDSGQTPEEGASDWAETMLNYGDLPEEFARDLIV